MKIFLEDIWLGRRKDKKGDGTGCFLPCPSKYFHPKLKRKLVRTKIHKAPLCNCAVALGVFDWSKNREDGK